MVDTAGVQSVKDAAIAGFTDIGIYIFPSVNAVGRKSPDEQIKEMVIAFEGTSYNRIWLDIEVCALGKYTCECEITVLHGNEMKNECTRVSLYQFIAICNEYNVLCSNVKIELSVF